MDYRVIKIIESLEKGKRRVEDAIRSITKIKSNEKNNRRKQKIKKIKILLEEVDKNKINKIWIPAIPLWLCKVLSNVAVSKINQKSHTNKKRDKSKEGDYILTKQLFKDSINELKKYEPFILVDVESDDLKVMIKAF